MQKRNRIIKKAAYFLTVFFTMSFLTFLFPEKVYATITEYKARLYVTLAEMVPLLLWSIFVGIFLILAVVTIIKLIFGNKVGKKLKTNLIFTSASAGIILNLILLFGLLRELSMSVLLSMTYSEFSTGYYDENIILTGNIISFSAPFLVIVGVFIFTLLFVNKKIKSNIKYLYYGLLFLALITLIICLVAIVSYKADFAYEFDIDSWIRK
jgi:hypothetical protein